MADIVAEGPPDRAARLRRLLQEAGLPECPDDSVETSLFFAVEEGEVIGGAALEVHLPCGLLRSLVVAPGHRRRGLGRRLAAAVCEEAARRGLEAVYLLTEADPAFFARLGFRPIGRREAPEEVQASAEFAALCPDSATAMVFPL